VVDGCRFKDLDRDGALTPYEDWRLSTADRAADLVGRMSLEQKAGLLVHGTLPAVGPPAIGRGTEYDFEALAPILSEHHVTTYITRLSTDAAAIADQPTQAFAVVVIGKWQRRVLRRRCHDLNSSWWACELRWDTCAVVSAGVLQTRGHAVHGQ
jgi:beta-glucosidase